MHVQMCLSQCKIEEVERRYSRIVFKLDKSVFQVHLMDGNDISPAY